MNLKGLKHGDITQWATKVLDENLRAIINAKSHLRVPYYILVIIKEGYDGPAAKGNSNELLHGDDLRQAPKTGQTKTVDMSKQRVVTNRLIIMLKPPVIPMLGSSLWRINNITGEVRCMYILPPDKPMIAGFTVEEDSKTLTKSSVGMPILYGAN